MNANVGGEFVWAAEVLHERVTGCHRAPARHQGGHCISVRRRGPSPNATDAPHRDRRARLLCRGHTGGHCIAERGNRVDDGPAQLRGLRALAGLTQEQLADLAGVHVRTVRGLETSHITSPRRYTLVHLARALGLDVSGQLALLETWGRGGVGPGELSRVTVRRDSANVIGDLLAASATSAMPVSLSETIVIGPDRLTDYRRTEEVLVALVDGVTGRHLFYAPEDDTVPVEDFHLSSLENCQVVRERIDPDTHAKLFDLSLGRSLNKGDSHVVRYAIDMAAARRSNRAVAPAGGCEIGGFVHSPASYILEVRFPAGAAPRECAQVFQARPTGPIRKLRRLLPGTAHSVHIALVHPKPGGHGIVWSW